MKCDHCGQEIPFQEKYCVHCGAPIPKYFKSEPFFYEGYIVWIIMNDIHDARQYIFYAGITFIAEVLLSDNEFYKNIREEESPMPYVFEKLKSQNIQMFEYSQKHFLGV